MKSLAKQLFLTIAFGALWMAFIPVVGGLAHATWDLLRIGWRWESYF